MPAPPGVRETRASHDLAPCDHRPYAALAVVVGVAFGLKGVLALCFYYPCAGAWGAFVLTWNWVSREGGGRYLQRYVQRVAERRLRPALSARHVPNAPQGFPGTPTDTVPQRLIRVCAVVVPESSQSLHGRAPRGRDAGSS